MNSNYLKGRKIMIKAYVEKEVPTREYALRFEQDECDARNNKLWVVIVDANTGEKVSNPYVFSISNNGIERAYSVNNEAMKALGIATYCGQIVTD